jgi:hypothetical protein
MGLASFLVGMVIGVVSVILGVSGWEFSRLWLYLLGSALFILVGIQLMISWILMRVLEDLSQREIQAQHDMNSALRN